MASEAFTPVGEANFEAAVVQRPGLTVVDFWSVTCIPCKQLTRVLEQIVPDLPAGVAITTVNADENPGLMDRYGVRGMPTLLFFKDGKVVDTRTGVDRRQVLKKAIEDHA